MSEQFQQPGGRHNLCQLRKPLDCAVQMSTFRWGENWLLSDLDGPWLDRRSAIVQIHDVALLRSAIRSRLASYGIDLVGQCMRSTTRGYLAGERYSSDRLRELSSDYRRILAHADTSTG